MKIKAVIGPDTLKIHRCCHAHRGSLSLMPTFFFATIIPTKGVYRECGRRPNPQAPAGPPPPPPISALLLIPKPITHLAGLADGRKRSISSHLDHYLFVLGLFLCTGLRSICLTHAAVVSEYSYRLGVDFFQVKLLICN